MKKKVSITINEKTLKEVNSIIDGISIRNRSQAIEFLVKKALGDSKIAVVLAGGKEENLKINGQYKPTTELGDSTLIEMSIKKLRENGFKEIFIVGRRPVLTEIFKIIGNGNSYGVEVEYVEEKKSRGSADTLGLLKGKIEKNFLVVYCDVIFNQINLKMLWKNHLKQPGLVTLLTSSSPRMPESTVGSVKLEGEKIVEFEEKPKEAQSYVFFSGIFVAEPGIFTYNEPSLERDVFPSLAKKKLLYGHMTSKKYLHIEKRDDIKPISEVLENF